eukprot:TRINITY_DN13106_c0_g1_i1.p1 TRINITY_DN13106_c0_g1~~TRINITY_DN13106_c0_g1_i1.p1  ORF type:complete len:415 (-),score=43.10 TRINITY_DN13106_c0_g1_i1:66-1124(-)
MAVERRLSDRGSGNASELHNGGRVQGGKGGKRTQRSGRGSSADHAREKMAAMRARALSEDAPHSDGMGRLVVLRSSKEQCPHSVDEADAHWQPVSRRRVRGKGWHIDAGPGFEGHELRTLEGDPRQGLVLLFLLSDCAPGHGGTAVVCGSHMWVRRKLEAQEREQEQHEKHEQQHQQQHIDEAKTMPDAEGREQSDGTPGRLRGVSQEALNEWCVREMLRMVQERRVRIAGTQRVSSEGRSTSSSKGEARLGAPQGSSARGRGATGGSDGVSGEACAENAFAAAVGEEEERPVWVEQVTGSAGDVVLLHPWAIHAGTTNLGSCPRLLANAMVRVRRDAFERDGGCQLLRALC